MNDPDVEFLHSSYDEGNGESSSAARVKKSYKMKQSERDARHAKKAKGSGKGPDSIQ